MAFFESQVIQKWLFYGLVSTFCLALTRCAVSEPKKGSNPVVLRSPNDKATFVSYIIMNNTIEAKRVPKYR